MPLSQELALLWTTRLISVALILQSLELWQIRRQWSDEGVWRWEILKCDYPAALRPLAGLVFAYPNFLGLLLLRLIAAVTVLWCPHPALFAFMFVTSLLVSMRWRGTFNGGSDAMTLVVLLGLSVGGPYGLWWIALQLCLSYLLSGWVKFKRTNWRSGKALAEFVKSPLYATPAVLQKLAQNPSAMLALAWLLIIFELTFPLALFAHTTVAYVAMAAVFHLAMVYAFGLNRFFFAWAAAYPALLWAAS